MFCVYCGIILNMNVYYVPSEKRRSIRIEITYAGDVKVSYPQSIDIKKVDDFVREKSKWISEKVAQVSASRNEFADIISFQKTLLLGKKVNIVFTPGLKRAELQSGVLFLPQKSKENVKDATKKFVLNFAKEVLPQCTAYFAEKVGKCPVKISVSHLKSKWGSCNANREIKLNAKTAMLPRELMEYIVIHELCHLFELNHSQTFWKKVRQFCPNADLMRKRLKNYSFLINLFD